MSAPKSHSCVVVFRPAGPATPLTPQLIVERLRFSPRRPQLASTLPTVSPVNLLYIRLVESLTTLVSTRLRCSCTQGAPADQVVSI